MTMSRATNAAAPRITASQPTTVPTVTLTPRVATKQTKKLKTAATKTMPPAIIDDLGVAILAGERPGETRRFAVEGRATLVMAGAPPAAARQPRARRPR